MGTWNTKIKIDTHALLESSIKNDLREIMYYTSFIQPNHTGMKQRFLVIVNILTDIEHKLYLDPNDMHDLKLLLIYKKPCIESRKTTYNKQIDYLDKIIAILLQMEKNISEEDCIYYNTIISIKEKFII